MRDNVTVFTTALGIATAAACSVGAPATETSAGRSAAAEQAMPKGERPEDRDQIDPDGVVRRGHALSGENALSVGAIMADAPQLDGRSVKVTGTVGRVCGKTGCWFELKGNDEARGIRITSKGYRFFVPSQAHGMTATLEGDLKVRMLDVSTAQHFADDEAEGTGRPAAKITAPVHEVSIAAVGLEMTQPKQDG